MHAVRCFSGLRRSPDGYRLGQVLVHGGSISTADRCAEPSPAGAAAIGRGIRQSRPPIQKTGEGCFGLRRQVDRPDSCRRLGRQGRSRHHFAYSGPVPVRNQPNAPTREHRAGIFSGSTVRRKWSATRKWTGIIRPTLTAQSIVTVPASDAVPSIKLVLKEPSPPANRPGNPD